MSKFKQLMKELDATIDDTPGTDAFFNFKVSQPELSEVKDFCMNMERRLNQRDKLSAICHNIYIARNIVHSDELMMDCLKEIDKIYRDENYN